MKVYKRVRSPDRGFISPHQRCSAAFFPPCRYASRIPVICSDALWCFVMLAADTRFFKATRTTQSIRPAPIVETNKCSMSKTLWNCPPCWSLPTRHYRVLDLGTVSVGEAHAVNVWPWIDRLIPAVCTLTPWGAPCLRCPDVVGRFCGGCLDCPNWEKERKENLLILDIDDLSDVVF